MSQLIVQIYKLSRSALKTKARVVKVNLDLFHIILQVNHSKTSHWNPRKNTVWYPHVVRGAMHSGKKWRSVLWFHAIQQYFRSKGSIIPYCLEKNAKSSKCLLKILPSNDISEPLGALKWMLEPRDVS